MFSNLIYLPCCNLRISNSFIGRELISSLLLLPPPCPSPSSRYSEVWCEARNANLFSQKTVGNVLFYIESILLYYPRQISPYYQTKTPDSDSGVLIIFNDLPCSTSLIFLGDQPITNYPTSEVPTSLSKRARYEIIALRISSVFAF